MHTSPPPLLHELFKIPRFSRRFGTTELLPHHSRLVGRQIRHARQSATVLRFPAANNRPRQFGQTAALQEHRPEREETGIVRDPFAPIRGGHAQDRCQQTTRVPWIYLSNFGRRDRDSRYLVQSLDGPYEG